MKVLFMISGKRKSAIAKAKVLSGKGAITFNDVPYNHLYSLHKLALIEPVRLYEEIVGPLNVDIALTAAGGGSEGQIQAARLALGKALVKHSKSMELKAAYLKYDRNLLVADTRRKETYKPGDSKARAKRQKSYR